MKRSQAVRVIAYVRAAPEEALADPVGWSERSAQAQDDIIRRWARDNGAQVVATLADNGSDVVGAVSMRTAFATALARVRDGHADAICVASLRDLSGDVVVQELLM